MKSKLALVRTLTVGHANSPREENNKWLEPKRITSGGWRTVETFWNAEGTAFFKAPAGAQIKVRYGSGWFGFDRQKQTLNGEDYKKLTVGLGSLGYARMQVKVSQTTDVTYDVYGDGVARSSPEIKF